LYCEIQTHKPQKVHKKAKEVIASFVSIHGGILGGSGLSHLLFFSDLFLPLLLFLSVGKIKRHQKGQLFPKPGG